MASTAYTVRIGGNTVFVVGGSLKIDKAVGKKSQASFTARTDTRTFFKQYQQVDIFDQNGVLVFAGYITSPKASKPGFQPSLTWSITCIGKEFLAKKRVIQVTYVNKTYGFIARDIFTNLLAAEGVTAGVIFDGPTCSNTLICSNTLLVDGNAVLPRIDFFCKATDALDTLVKGASSAGIPYFWAIDQNGAGSFAPYGAVTGPTIDDTQIDQMNNPPSITFANPNYRNAQYVTGGFAQTAAQNETIVGDGSKRSFPLGFQLASAPTIVIGGVTQTTGMKGTTGSQWYWALGDNIITQDSSQTVLGSGATAPVSYVGQYPNTALVSNAAQIAYQASVDGSSGIMEEIATDATLTTASDALTEGGSLLTRFAQQGAQLVGTTRLTGFEPGQLCPVNMPYFGLVSAQALIETVSIADLDGVNIWYTLTSVVGPYDTTWVDFFSRLLSSQAAANSANAGQSTSTSILLSLPASVTPTANLNISVFACPITGNATFASNTTIVC
ncbi:MAG: hypothetical protein ACRDHZ_00790 [Ktedonobacteraceae bacterium]